MGPDLGLVTCFFDHVEHNTFIFFGLKFSHLKNGTPVLQGCYMRTSDHGKDLAGYHAAVKETKGTVIWASLFSSQVTVCIEAPVANLVTPQYCKVNFLLY